MSYIADYKRARRAKARAEGQCQQCCKAAALPNLSRCEPCRDAQRELNRRLAELARATRPPAISYETKKLTGICTYRGCQAGASDDHLMCPRHRDQARERNRRSANARRALRRAFGGSL